MQDFKYQQVDITCIVQDDLDVQKFVEAINVLGNIYIEKMQTYQNEIFLHRMERKKPHKVYEPRLDVIFYSDHLFTHADIIELCNSCDGIFHVEALNIKYYSSIQPGTAGYSEYSSVMQKLAASKP